MIVEWAGALATKLGDLVTTYLPVFITKLGEWWNYAKQLAGTLVDVGNQVWNFITGVKAALQPVIDFVQALCRAKRHPFGRSGGVWGGSGGVFAAFVASLAPVLAVLGTAITVVAAFRDGWTNGFGAIREIVSGVLAYLKQQLAGWIATLQSWGAGNLAMDYKCNADSAQ